MLISKCTQWICWIIEQRQNWNESNNLIWVLKAKQGEEKEKFELETKNIQCWNDRFEFENKKMRKKACKNESSFWIQLSFWKEEFAVKCKLTKRRKDFLTWMSYILKK